MHVNVCLYKLCSPGKIEHSYLFIYVRPAVDVAGNGSSDVYLRRRLAAAAHVGTNVADSFDLSDPGTEFDISDADEWEVCEAADERGRAGEIRYSSLKILPFLYLASQYVQSGALGCF